MARRKSLARVALFCNSIFCIIKCTIYNNIVQVYHADKQYKSYTIYKKGFINKYKSYIYPEICVRHSFFSCGQLLLCSVQLERNKALPNNKGSGRRQWGGRVSGSLWEVHAKQPIHLP